MTLTGPYAEQQVTLRMPTPARAENVRLELRVRFSRDLLPQSNLEVLANGTRVALVTRPDSNLRDGAAMRIEVPAQTLRGDFLVLTLRTAIATNLDVCLDDRLGRGHVEIDASSFVAFEIPVTSMVSVGAVWASLPETVTVALPARTLTTSEFTLAHKISMLAKHASHVVRYVALPAPGDLVVGSPSGMTGVDSRSPAASDGANIFAFRYANAGQDQMGLALMPSAGLAMADLLSSPWLPIANASAAHVVRARRNWHSERDDPTLGDLGIVDLQRNVAREAEWHIPIDVRDFPPDRLPSEIALDVVTAPNTHDRDLVLYVFLNGTLVRTYDINPGGEPQRVTVRLPSRMLATRNDIRVVMERQVREAHNGCGVSISSMPAQILPQSRVTTARADAAVPVFLTVTAGIGGNSPVYLPAGALEAAPDYLSLLTSVADAFWNDTRMPFVVFYDAAPTTPPAGSFIVVGTPKGAELTGPATSDSGRLRIQRRGSSEMLLDIRAIERLTVAQVVTWNGHTGVQFRIPASSRAVPAAPENYDQADLLIASADTALSRLNTGGSDEELVINNGPTLRQRFANDRWLWWALAAVLLLPPLVWSVRTIRRRTPRRVLARSFSRSARDEQKPE